MTCLVKNKNKFYRKTLLDVWGQHMIYQKISKALNFMRFIKVTSKLRKRFYNKEFLFSLQKRIFFRRKKFLKKNFLDIRLLLNFYIIVKKKHFRKFYSQASRKVGSFIGHYLTKLELRLFMIAFRSNFITNIFMIRYILKYGIFFLNGTKVKKDINYSLKVGDVLELMPSYNRVIKWDMMARFVCNNILWKPPGYLFINYNFMLIMFWRAPVLDDVTFPVELDIFIANEFYF